MHDSRPTTSSWPSNPLGASSLEPQIRLWLTIVRVYKLYLLTYLLTYLLVWAASEPVTSARSQVVETSLDSRRTCGVEVKALSSRTLQLMSTVTLLYACSQLWSHTYNIT